MTVRVAINGFGRIGRNILRAVVESHRKDITVVAVNDLAPIETSAHLLQYDSVHGRFPKKVQREDNRLNVGDGWIEVSSVRVPQELSWAKLGVDIVLECTGVFTEREKAAQHLQAGARRVLISAPATGADKTIVYGVNQHLLTSDDVIVSNASCTTNCLAPMAMVLNAAFGIEKGFMTTVHAYTGDQPVLDTAHKDLYRARAAALSMIPTSTGAAKAVGLVLPELAGRLDGVAIRVPVPNVSVVDFKFIPKRSVTYQEVNEAFRHAAEGNLAGILSVTDAPLVSSDLNHDPHSCVFHADQTRLIGGNFVRVLAWYDNEWGFSNRMADVAAEMGKHLL